MKEGYGVHPPNMARPRDGGGEAEESLLLPAGKASKYVRCTSHAGDELRSFRWCLRWMCMDRSSPWRALVSWSLFLLLGVAIPALSHFVLDRRPYNVVVQLSLTAASALAFIRLSAFLGRYGLRRLLFLDKLRGESERVRAEYTAELTQSFRLLACLVGPCSAAELGYKVWWYCTEAGRIPFIGNPVVSGAVACTLEVASWVYRMGMFLLVCLLFRVICQLQILRLQDFATVFQQESEVAAVLREHLRIRRQLRIISHRFRSFIVAGLSIVTASQFVALLVTTRPQAEVTLFNGTELAICSIVLVAGMLMCLKNAAKITHKAQALTSHAAKWHVCATIDSYEMDPETPSAVPSNQAAQLNNGDDESDEEETCDEDELDDTKLLLPYANTISFQKRQALVAYLENNQAGITVFGFVMDRAWLHAIFMIELSLALWLLGKTIGIS